MHHVTPKQRLFVTEHLVDLNATQAAIRAGYSPKTAPQQGSRLFRNVVVQAAIATQQAQQLEAVEVRIEDVLRDLKAIAHTDLHVLSEQSGAGPLGGQIESARAVDEAPRSGGPRDASARALACAFHAGTVAADVRRPAGPGRSGVYGAGDAGAGSRSG